jgi:C4-dicarboxylate-specific signal transduction histidine kinase
VVNALQALEEHGTIVVSAWWQDEELVISVKDDGPGIPDEMQSSVFEPFITSKQDGTGLGLSIVRKLVKDLGGTITLNCPDTGGVEMNIYLARVGRQSKTMRKAV